MTKTEQVARFLRYGSFMENGQAVPTPSDPALRAVQDLCAKDPSLRSKAPRTILTRAEAAIKPKAASKKKAATKKKTATKKTT